MLTGADDVAIGQETAVVDGINLAGYPLFQQPILVELVVKVLGDFVVLRRVRSTERIEGKSETFSEFLLNGMHLRAVFFDWQPRLMRGELCRRAMLVRRTNEQNFPSTRPLKTGIGIGRKHRADEVTKMLYAVDVRER